MGVERPYVSQDDYSDEYVFSVGYSTMYFHVGLFGCFVYLYMGLTSFLVSIE